MTRSRKNEYRIFSLFRKPTILVFELLPGFFARWFLRLFRWSESSLGYGIRYLCVHRLAKSCGNKVLIFPGCILHWLENCEFGENVTIHDFCYIDAIGGIKIGDNTRIAHNCSLISGQHRFDIPEKKIVDSGGTRQPINIGFDVWLATGVVVLQGVSIGNGAIIGANSVVTKDVEPDVVAAGIPATFIKNRFEDSNKSTND